MIRTILTDIEGTTSSLSYVKEVMFPYSRKRLRGFLQEHWEEERVKSIVERLSERLGRKVDLELATKTFEEWIDKDLKEGLLKELQGHIWEEGFLSGELKGHVYEDAYVKLKEWKEKGYRLYVYSSGSVKAQRLFFGHTDYGDITPLFDGLFDTSIGSKRSPESYRRIAETIGVPPQEILFLSDLEEELDSAKSICIEVVRVCREDHCNSRHRVISSFYELDL
ncbi:MAG: acireductone synthase [Acidobacteria bacterium]|jgi:enolase-phosphatase E1|nr:MAG: acireductone synthase [Acidobacteriota bacterium]